MADGHQNGIAKQIFGSVEELLQVPGRSIKTAWRRRTVLLQNIGKDPIYGSLTGHHPAEVQIECRDDTKQQHNDLNDNSCFRFCLKGMEESFYHIRFFVACHLQRDVIHGTIAGPRSNHRDTADIPIRDSRS